MRHDVSAAVRYGLWIAIWLWVSGCAGSQPVMSGGGAGARSPQADAGPLPVVTSDSGKLQIETHTDPDQPPTRGVSTVSLAITDATTGEPSDGLELAVVPWMPAMGHGTSVKPSIEANGDGHYTIGRVNMYMGGKWDLRITISGAATDSATLHFSIR